MKIVSNSKSEPIISVYGLGNVGGPLAAAWLRAGFTVIGVDISNVLLAKIRNDNSHTKEPYVTETFREGLRKGTLFLTKDGIEGSKKSTVKIIAVPVALKKNRIDFSALISVTKDIAKGMKKGDAVIVTPSLPPGTTRNVILSILQKISKLKVEKEFYLIYNPERIFEGRALQDIEENYPAIVAGFGPKSLDFGKNLIKKISQKGALLLSSLESAEAEKLFEGVYRDVNIALANELAEYCERVGVNYWEARKAANSQPFCHLHYAGTGVGGLCIPVYPRFVIESSNKKGKHVKLIEYARKTNDFMPKKCVSDAINLLQKNNINLQGTKVAVLGLGFRGEVTDPRLSPTYVVVSEFLKKGCEIAVHDPYILKDKKLPKNVNLTNNLNDVTKDASLIFISTDHKMYTKLNEKSLSKARKPLLIFDGRNVIDSKFFKNASVLKIGSRTY